MSNRQIRPLRPADFPALMRLEEEVFGRTGEGVLGPYYVRLCCEFFAESCFVAEEDGQVVGYVLCFVREREAYCTTLAVAPGRQGSRVAIQLVRRLVEAVEGRVDACWFTVKEDNVSARQLHRALGARDVEVREDFYGPGDRRIVSRIDRAGLERVRQRAEKLGLAPERPVAQVARLDGAAGAA